MDYFLDKGMNTFRVPFRWERLQTAQNTAFNATELGRLKTFVNYATSQGAHVVLDPHNYARYYGAVVGSAALPNASLADFWTRLSNEFKTNDRVIFGLMNEPNTMPTEQWRDAANAAISAIRDYGRNESHPRARQCLDGGPQLVAELVWHAERHRDARHHRPRQQLRL